MENAGTRTVDWILVSVFPAKRIFSTNFMNSFPDLGSQISAPWQFRKVNYG